MISNTKAIEQLVASDQYSRLLALRPEFNFFDMVGSHLDENATSRAIAFLVDSNNSHGLGSRFFDAWIRQIHRERINEESDRLTIEQLLNLRGDEISATVEWGTHERRRIDILIRILDGDRKLKAVIGVENKHWAPEQVGQVGHYQDELNRQDSFRDARTKIIVFLTPAARNHPKTGVASTTCPYVPCSYKTVVNALLEVEMDTTDEIRVLIESLRRYLEKFNSELDPMSGAAAKLVHDLYGDSDHRRAMKLILEHYPSWGRLTEEIVKKTKQRLPKAEDGSDVPREADGNFEFYPSTGDPSRRTDIYFSSAHLNELTRRDGYAIYFILRTKTGAEAGDEVSLLVEAQIENPKAAQKSALKKILQESLANTAGPKTTSVTDWTFKAYSWIPICHDGPFQLVDLGGEDIENCAEALASLINTTYPKLKNLYETGSKSIGNQQA